MLLIVLDADTIDVLTTVEKLKAKGVSIISKREWGDLSTDVGKRMLTMLISLAELERKNIKREKWLVSQRAKDQGKAMGRQKQIDDAKVAERRMENSASIKQTAEHFGISLTSVKMACTSHATP